MALGVTWWLGISKPTTRPANTLAAPVSEETIFASYGKSPGCKSCHEEAYNNWDKSHHALAERAVTLGEDGVAFEPAREITHGTQTSHATRTNDLLQLIATGRDGQR